MWIRNAFKFSQIEAGMVSLSNSFCSTGKNKCFSSGRYNRWNWFTCTDSNSNSSVYRQEVSFDSFIWETSLVSNSRRIRCVYFVANHIFPSVCYVFVTLCSFLQRKKNTTFIFAQPWNYIFGKFWKLSSTLICIFCCCWMPCALAKNRYLFLWLLLLPYYCPYVCKYVTTAK